MKASEARDLSVEGETQAVTRLLSLAHGEVRQAAHKGRFHALVPFGDLPMAVAKSAIKRLKAEDFKASVCYGLAEDTGLERGKTILVEWGRQ